MYCTRRLTQGSRELQSDMIAVALFFGIGCSGSGISSGGDSSISSSDPEGSRMRHY